MAQEAFRSVKSLELHVLVFLCFQLFSFVAGHFLRGRVYARKRKDNQSSD